MSHIRRIPVAVSAAAATMLVLTGCQRAAEEKPAATPAAWTLDESKLQQPIRFAASDLDPTQNACKATPSICGQAMRPARTSAPT